MSGYSDTWADDPRETQWEGQGLMQPWLDPVDWVAGPLGMSRKVGLMGALRMLPGSMAGNILPDILAGRAAENLQGHPIAQTVLPLGISMLGGMASDAAIRKATPAISKAYHGSRLMGSERGIFGGVKAQNADLSAMRQAMRMQEAGIPEKEIWQKTGWMQGDDGLMRFEIDDSNVMPLPRTWGERKDLEAGNTTFTKRQRALAHPRLSASYPETKNIPVRLTRDMKGGSFREDVAFRPYITAGAFEDYKPDPNTIIHELQHAVQQREGFASGGSPGGMAREATDLHFTIQELDAQMKHIAEQKNIIARSKIIKGEEKIRDIEVLSKIYNDLKMQKIEGLKIVDQRPFDAYQRLHGEAEARLASKRMNYTPEQRRAVFPYDDLDVPRDELIMRGEGGGMMASVGEEPINKYESGIFGVGALPPLPPDFIPPKPFKTMTTKDGMIVNSFPIPDNYKGRVVPRQPDKNYFRYPPSTPLKPPSLKFKRVL